MGLSNLSILLSLSLAIAVIAYVSLMVANRRRLFEGTAVVLGMLLLLYANTPTALAVEDLGRNLATITGQQQLQEELKLTPEGDHYSGLEYSERTGPKEKAVSDETIEDSIESFAGDDVIVAVANGSVRLSGRVKDKKTAQNIIDKTKEIPGVHEVTFNLGLDN
jgi:osmotically-inducible protein OsmY